MRRQELMEWPSFGFHPFDRLVPVEDRIADGRYVLRAELPGIDPDHDVAVIVDGGALHIRAGGTGATARSVTLPPAADVGDVRATYRGGVLEVSVGLAAGGAATGRRITVEH